MKIWGYLRCPCGGFPALGLEWHSVQCGKCGKRTGVYRLQIEAMDAWNALVTGEGEAVQIIPEVRGQLSLFKEVPNGR